MVNLHHAWALVELAKHLLRGSVVSKFTERVHDVSSYGSFRECECLCPGLLTLFLPVLDWKYQREKKLPTAGDLVNWWKRGGLRPLHYSTLYFDSNGLQCMNIGKWVFQAGCLTCVLQRQMNLGPRRSSPRPFFRGLSTALKAKAEMQSKSVGLLPSKGGGRPDGYNQSDFMYLLGPIWSSPSL